MVLARAFVIQSRGSSHHFQLAIDAGCNAYAAPLGFLEAGVLR